MSARWSSGVVVGLPLACLAVLLVAAFSVYCWRRSPHTPGADTLDDGWKVMYRSGFTALALMLLGLPWAFFPWSAQYHRYVPKGGTVASVSSRFIGDGHSTSQKFAVEMTDGSTYGCNDTRCSVVKPGDHLTLSCKRAWQWTGVPGWDCNYVTDERATP